MLIPPNELWCYFMVLKKKKVCWDCTEFFSVKEKLSLHYANVLFSFLQQSLSKYLQFLSCRFWTFLAEFIFRSFTFLFVSYCEWNLWIIPWFLLLLILHINLLASAGSSFCIWNICQTYTWFPVATPLPSLLTSIKDHSVSTHTPYCPFLPTFQTYFSKGTLNHVNTTSFKAL